ncbi:peptidylprolyl isomerase [Rhodobacter sp. KR11]|uniref:peptidylprolyl isomerase n=1 Tax=Rhodobacter sp. KR11 TaxID=2974588 RepID=UPI0022231486|nr:peptidylprolyl isomerase [Rhodobacter sp. KR11]MCW1919585.1 peptidylprolyl isomerase [Rhodobacter sp. KR11]
MLRKLLALAILAASPAFAEGDGPGPNLTIEVTGAANGTVVIDLASDIAPNHVARIVELAKSGAYDGVVFHRVIEGFMAQTGDVKYGKTGGDLTMAGMGGSDLPDLKAEFSDVPFERGVIGMARAQDPDSANSQFFIMFAPGEFLNGQYTVVGKVISGMEIVDAIKLGDGANGEVTEPDVMTKVTVAE